MKSMLAIGLLAWVCSSCSDDEKIVQLMNPQEICSTYIGSQRTHVQWNGVDLDYGKVTFFPVENDSTKLQMVLEDIIPSLHGEEKYIDDIPTTVCGVSVEVDVTSEENGIRFSGSRNAFSYRLSVEGVYTAPAEGTDDVGTVDLQCDYQVTSNLDREVPYIIRMDPEHICRQAIWSGTVDWDGQTYDKNDFIDNVLSKILQRISQEVEAIQLVFQEGTSLDIALQYASETSFTPWMTIRYWFSEMSGMMYWEFTKEQKEMFYEQWTGKPTETYGWTPFIDYVATIERPLIDLFYWNQDPAVIFSMRNPYEYGLINMYLLAKGQEGLNEKEKEELELFGQLVLEHHSKHYMEYGYMFGMIAEKSE